ncbi:hypothetical protein D0469_07100 [Peribacillus saganii]|uniref:Uncharacterized protein n=1 Tax=Peribacillus saganii TaxID=2303992 RepID=A0A372LQ74_9BACI|nr:hypothetical protein [Peribacillus saganii]RFU70361.1 hypothetical protein D0469_07100 [Peribacillus saganii]
MKEYKDYRTIYISAQGEKTDAEEIARVINIWAEDGAVLHSVVPRIYEGSTEGYYIILETTEVE